MTAQLLLGFLALAASRLGRGGLFLLASAACVRAASPAPVDARGALVSYMQEIVARAEKEKPARVAEPDDPFKRLLAQSQDHAEAGRFRESAQTLRTLLAAPDRPDYYVPWCRERIAALGRLERGVDLASVRKLFLDANPHWFKQRLKPVTMAWRVPTTDVTARVRLVADLFAQAEDDRGQRLALVLLVETNGLPTGELPEALLTIGNLAFKARDVPAAVRAWDRVVREMPRTSPWFMSLHNLGLAKQERRDYHAAIEHLTQLIESKPPNLEPGGHIMENYRNYSHRAAIGISECHEALGDYAAALRWAQLSGSTYRLESWCGNCAMAAAEEMKQRLDRLKAKAAAKR